MITNDKPPLEDTFDLTDREVEVLYSLSLGNTVSRIAREMNISSNTVKYHLGRIYRKLDVPTQAGAVAKSIRHGII